MYLFDSLTWGFFWLFCILCHAPIFFYHSSVLYPSKCNIHILQVKGKVSQKACKFTSWEIDKDIIPVIVPFFGTLSLWEKMLILLTQPLLKITIQTAQFHFISKLTLSGAGHLKEVEIKEKSWKVFFYKYCLAVPLFTVGNLVKLYQFYN